MRQPLYPIGIQTFSDIIENGYIYVDKTEYITKLLSSGKYYFLSRPRRFGKSLLISTLEEVFRGNRGLFNGLYISNTDYDWAAHVVLHLDFSGTNCTNPDSVVNKLHSSVSRWEQYLNMSVSESSIEQRFRNVIQCAHEKSGRQVVILIDEYDKPLLETVDNPELQNTFRTQLRAFYGNLKNQDKHIRFAMLTGVTKFGHLSIFSDLNNLQDISMLEEFAGICGVTNDELYNYFDKGISTLAQRRGMTTEEAYEQLRLNYDGYRFSPLGGPDIYNPFSLLNCLKTSWIRDYWFQTGTPTFLIKLIMSRQIELRSLDSLKTPMQSVENVSYDLKSSLIPVLYQAGYLTIRDYDPITDLLTLAFPNREVQRGFLISLMNLYVPSDNDSAFSIAKFYEDVQQGDADSFMTRLQSLFADFNYEAFNRINLEQHYQDITYLVFKLLGFLIHVEYKTASGRMDMLVKNDRYIFVFEFKLNSTAENALHQIDEKGYMLPFKADNRKLVKIGANFSDKTRNLDSWIIEEA